MEQTIDTFDDGDYTTGPMEEGESFEEEESGEEGQDTTEVSDESHSREEISEDSQVNLLDEEEDEDGEEDEEDGEEEDSDGDEEDEEDDEDSESDDNPEGDAREDSGQPEEEVRAIKAFSGGKQYDIPEDATIRTKVDGKWEKPTLQELKDNYAGKVAYDEKFSSLGDERKAHEDTKATYEAEIDGLRGHMGNIAGLVKNAMAGEGNPLDAMDYLLDLMGADTVQFNKLAYENMANDFDVYAQMTEVERESHWMKKENAVLTRNQESLKTNRATEQAQAELSSKVNSLREAHGISEEAYVSAAEDLKAEGYENVAPESIVQAAQLKPLLATADSMIEQYLDQLTDEEASSLAVDIATNMHETPELTQEQVEKILAEQFKVETIVSKIEKKIGSGKKSKVKSTSKKTAALESFEDFDS